MFKRFTISVILSNLFICSHLSAQMLSKDQAHSIYEKGLKYLLSNNANIPVHAYQHFSFKNPSQSKINDIAGPKKIHSIAVLDPQKYSNDYDTAIKNVIKQFNEGAYNIHWQLKKDISNNQESLVIDIDSKNLENIKIYNLFNTGNEFKLSGISNAKSLRIAMFLTNREIGGVKTVILKSRQSVAPLSKGEILLQQGRETPKGNLLQKVTKPIKRYFSNRNAIKQNRQNVHQVQKNKRVLVKNRANIKSSSIRRNKPKIGLNRFNKRNYKIQNQRQKHYSSKKRK